MSRGITPTAKADKPARHKIMSVDGASLSKHLGTSPACFPGNHGRNLFDTVGRADRGHQPFGLGNQLIGAYVRFDREPFRAGTYLRRDCSRLP